MTHRLVFKFILSRSKWLFTAIALLAMSGTASAADVVVTIENTGSTGSVFFTPFWIGAHDGTFDTYDGGVLASTFPGLEDLAEDGNTGPLSGRFATEQATGVDTTVLATSVGPPPFDPGESASIIFSVPDPTTDRYFSYASMLIPSNDAFVANGNPLAHELFDAAGNFTGPFTIEIFGRDVNDAGTEVNSETSVAFLAGANGQTGPNMGADEGAVVSAHPGFNGSVGNPLGTPVNILGAMTPSGANIDTVQGDFTRSGGDVLLARITVEAVPEPSSIALAVMGMLALCGISWRRRSQVAK